MKGSCVAVKCKASGMRININPVSVTICIVSLFTGYPERPPTISQGRTMDGPVGQHAVSGRR